MGWKMKVIFSLLVIMLMFLSISCNPDSPLAVVFSSPKCEITYIEKYDSSLGEFTRFTITLINYDDGATTFNTGCIIKLKEGITIIDRGSAYFVALNQAESAVDKAWFSNILDQTQYDSYEISLYWYDSQGNYYTQ